MDGKPFDGGKAEHYSLKLGSKSFIPGFEDALIGAAAGEERDVNVTFPTDYTPELAATHHIPGCSLDAMQTLFDQIISGTAG